MLPSLPRNWRVAHSSTIGGTPGDSSRDKSSIRSVAYRTQETRSALRFCPDCYPYVRVRLDVHKTILMFAQYVVDMPEYGHMVCRCVMYRVVCMQVQQAMALSEILPGARLVFAGST